MSLSIPKPVVYNLSGSIFEDIDEYNFDDVEPSDIGLEDAVDSTSMRLTKPTTPQYEVSRCELPPKLADRVDRVYQWEKDILCSGFKKDERSLKALQKVSKLENLPQNIDMPHTAHGVLKPTRTTRLAGEGFFWEEPKDNSPEAVQKSMEDFCKNNFPSFSAGWFQPATCANRIGNIVICLSILAAIVFAAYGLYQLGSTPIDGSALIVPGGTIGGAFALGLLLKGIAYKRKKKEAANQPRKFNQIYQKYLQIPQKHRKICEEFATNLGSPYYWAVEEYRQIPKKYRKFFKEREDLTTKTETQRRLKDSGFGDDNDD